MAHPKLMAASDDFWPEELQAMYDARAKTPRPLGDMPLVVLIASGRGEDAPPNIPDDEWKRIVEEKKQQKAGFADLSSNSLLVFADKSGHHIQLAQPELVINAIRRVVDAARTGKKLSESK